MLRLATAAAIAAAPIAQARQTLTEHMNAEFAERPPLVGEPLPDARGHAEDGSPFTLADTRGQLTVLVAGCLT